MKYYCFICKESGHKTDLCQKNKNNQNKELKFVCFVCFKEGHYATTCP
jgi:hypothetical protein